MSGLSTEQPLLDLSKTGDIGPTETFLTFFRANQARGFDIHGNERPYFPPSARSKHWTRANILAGRNAYRFTANVLNIQDRYLGILSLLAYTDHLRFFQKFLSMSLCDDLFPLTNVDAWFPDPAYKALGDAIQEHQWAFFPLIFDKNKLEDCELSDSYILPISSRILLHKSIFAEVYKITIDNAFNKLVDDDDGSPTRKTFVLKVYQSQYRNQYTNEYRAFTHLHDHPAPNIIGYHGAFRLKDKYCLLLVHADGGTLRDILHMQPPSTIEERLQFWRNYSGVFDGLNRIQQVFHDKRGIHGDIKPDNLLCKRGPTESPYDFVVKIADLGHSDVCHVGLDGEDTLNLDRHGNQRYSSPEGSHHNEKPPTGPNRITHKADVFSAGCLTSEIIVWMTLGKRGRLLYDKMREEALAKLPSFKGSGYGACFHDGVKRLDEVDKIHLLALQEEHANFEDTTMPKIISLIENHMLLDTPSDRWSAKAVKNQMELILDAAQAAHQPELTRSINSVFDAMTIEGVIDSAVQGLPSPTTLPETLNKSQRHLSEVSDCTNTTTSTASTRTTSIVSATESVDSFLDERGRQVCDHGDTEAIPEREGRGPTVQHRDTIDTQSSESSEATLRPRQSGTAQSSSATSGMPTLRIPANEGSSILSPLSPSGMYYLSLRDLGAYRSAKKAKDPIPLDLKKRIERMQDYAKDRDLIFLVDDSESMKQHKSEAEHAFRLLSYIGKEVDEDGIELVFVSDPKVTYKKRGTTKLARQFERRKFNNPADTMENHFGVFLENCLLPRFGPSSWRTRKRVSVLILTDGRWGSREAGAGGVENPVRNLIESLIHRNLDRTHVMLSFIRFGDDEIGKRYLDFLDDFGKTEWFHTRNTSPRHFDIADTGSINGNIVKLFAGSISELNDDDDEPRQQHTPVSSVDLSSCRFTPAAPLQDTCTYLPSRRYVDR